MSSLHLLSHHHPSQITMSTNCFLQKKEKKEKYKILRISEVRMRRRNSQHYLDPLGLKHTTGYIAQCQQQSSTSTHAHAVSVDQEQSKEKSLWLGSLYKSDDFTRLIKLLKKRCNYSSCVIDDCEICCNEIFVKLGHFREKIVECEYYLKRTERVGMRYCCIPYSKNDDDIVRRNLAPHASRMIKSQKIYQVLSAQTHNDKTNNKQIDSLIVKRKRKHFYVLLGQHERAAFKALKFQIENFKKLFIVYTFDRERNEMCYELMQQQKRKLFFTFLFQ